MRVIAGEAHGRKLTTLPGEEVTRPTIERVKEAMFSSVQFLVPGARVLDLFAGSGQLGIEALSRGAKSCTFLDADRDAVAVVMQNCRTAGVFDRSRISTGDAFGFAAASRETYDLIFLDPPYRHGTLEKLLPLLAPRLASGGVILCESELEAVLPEKIEDLVKRKTYRYGKVLVTRYEKEGES